MTSAFSSKNSVSLFPASFCTPRPNLPIIPGISGLPAFAFQFPVMKRTSFFGVSSRRSCLFYPNPTLLRFFSLSRFYFCVSKEHAHMAFIWCSSWKYNILTFCYVRLNCFFQSSLWYLLTKQTFSSPFSNVGIGYLINFV